MIINLIKSVWFSLALKSAVAVFILMPLSTAAYFSRIETAGEQNLTAGRLVLEQLFNGAVFLTPQVKQSEVSVEIALESGSIDALHDVAVSDLGGDVALCGSLDLTVTNPSGATSEGLLPDFVSDATTQFGDWNFDFAYPTDLTNIPHGAVCAIQFTATAWQANMTKETAGFRHSRTFVIEVALGAVVLNEILANPETSGGEREFIELYNFSGLPVDVAGWNIAERTATNQAVNHFISGTSTGVAADLVALDGTFNTVIAPGGFLALRYRGSSAYLNIPGDTVTLIETPTGRVLDEFTYVDAPRSDTFSRIPDGFGVWVVASATPDATNGTLPSEGMMMGMSMAETLLEDNDENISETSDIADTVGGVGNSTSPDELPTDDTEVSEGTESSYDADIHSESEVDNLTDPVSQIEEEKVEKSESEKPAEEVVVEVSAEATDIENGPNLKSEDDEIEPEGGAESLSLLTDHDDLPEPLPLSDTDV